MERRRVYIRIGGHSEGVLAHHLVHINEDLHSLRTEKNSLVWLWFGKEKSWFHHK